MKFSGATKWCTSLATSVELLPGRIASCERGFAVTLLEAPHCDIFARVISPFISFFAATAIHIFALMTRERTLRTRRQLRATVLIHLPLQRISLPLPFAIVFFTIQIEL